MKSLKLTSVAIYFLLFVCSSIYAHPHLFVAASIDLQIENNKVTGVRVHWNWDQWWSMDVINDCDLDGNGVFNEEESELVYEYFFEGIKNLGFFTEIFADGKKQSFSRVIDFRAVIEDDKTVTYQFTVPISVELKDDLKLEIRFDDPTIFVAFDNRIEPVKDNPTFKLTETNNYGFFGVYALVEMIGE